MRSTVFAVLLCLALAAAPQLRAQGCPPPPNIPVGDCAPKAGTAGNFAGDSGPMRLRKSIYVLSPSEIKELRLAFERLRALPNSDPRSWMAQANVHCWYCAGDNSTIGDVHVTWAFMPWHRDYLYMLEKILGSLVNNPQFALPYWDWNTPDTPTCTGHLKVPPPYLGKDVPPPPPGIANSLFDCYRGISTTSTMNVASVGKARVDDILKKANTFALFFGGPNVSAALWPGPHGYVHLWTGDPVTLAAKQDMGVLETAARDPLFWAHHANIDRLWDVWIGMYGTPAYDPTFLAQKWTFWNENQKLITMTGSDAANRTSRLRYAYAAPCSQTAMEAEAAAPRKAPAARTFKIGATSGAHVVVNLEQLTVPADQSAVLRVYIDEPGATAATGADSRLADELFIVPGKTPGSGHGGHQHTFNLKIVLSPELAAEVAAANGKVPITIVPVAATPRGQLTAPAPPNFKVKRSYISVE